VHVLAISGKYKALISHYGIAINGTPLWDPVNFSETQNHKEAAQLLAGVRLSLDEANNMIYKYMTGYLGPGKDQTIPEGLIGVGESTLRQASGIPSPHPWQEVLPFVWSNCNGRWLLIL
jgi:hypothetical protein